MIVVFKFKEKQNLLTPIQRPDSKGADLGGRGWIRWLVTPVLDKQKQN